MLIYFFFWLVFKLIIMIKKLMMMVIQLMAMIKKMMWMIKKIMLILMVMMVMQMMVMIKKMMMMMMMLMQMMVMVMMMMQVMMFKRRKSRYCRSTFYLICEFIILSPFFFFVLNTSIKVLEDQLILVVKKQHLDRQSYHMCRGGGLESTKLYCCRNDETSGPHEVDLVLSPRPTLVILHRPKGPRSHRVTSHGWLW